MAPWACRAPAKSERCRLRAVSTWTAGSFDLANAQSVLNNQSGATIINLQNTSDAENITGAGTINIAGSVVVNSSANDTTLPPIDSPSLTASILNSAVYCRFATCSFLPISPSVHQKFTNNLMYVKPGQGHTNNATLVNAGTFTVSGAGGIDALTGTNMISNLGTFTKTGTGTAVVFGTAAPLTFDNGPAGLIEVQGGTLQIPGGTLGGTLSVATGAQLLLEGGTNQFLNGSLITGGGALTFVPGVGGSISFTGTTSGTTVDAGATLSFNGVTATGTGMINNLGTLDLTSATLDATINNSGTATVTNSALNGSVAVSGGNVLATNYNALGTTSVSGGSLNVDGTGTLGTLNAAAGSFGGAGSVTASVLNLSGGTLNGTGNLTVSNFNPPVGGGSVGNLYQNLSLTHAGNFAVGNYSARNSLKLVASSGSFAAIEAVTGNASVSAANAIIMSPGTGTNTDASILAPHGTLTITAVGCTECITLGANPLPNQSTEQGLYGSSVVINIPSPAPASALVQVDNSIIYAASLAETGGQANTDYNQPPQEEEEEKKASQDTVTTGSNKNDGKQKPKVPVCM